MVYQELRLQLNNVSKCMEKNCISVESIKAVDIITNKDGIVENILTGISLLRHKIQTVQTGIYLGITLEQQLDWGKK